MKRIKFLIFPFYIFAITNSVSAKLDQNSYWYGYAKGYLASTCYDYQKGFLSYSRAKQSFKIVFSLMDNTISDLEYRNSLLSFADNPQNKKCKQLMPWCMQFSYEEKVNFS